MTEQPVEAHKAPVLPTFDTPMNLGAQRAKRNERRPQPQFVLDGGVVVKAPKGLPIPAFAPLKNIDLDLALLSRLVLEAQRAGGAEAAGQILIDFFIGNPRLPWQVLDAVSQVLRNLFTDEGFEALLAWGPEPEDMAAIARALFDHYGASLGELSGSSTSSTGTGEPSTPTSDGSTASTSALPSTANPAALDGSPSAA
jgi:hypothetical protein